MQSGPRRGSGTDRIAVGGRRLFAEHRVAHVRTRDQPGAVSEAFDDVERVRGDRDHVVGGLHDQHGSGFRLLPVRDIERPGGLDLEGRDERVPTTGPRRRIVARREERPIDRREMRLGIEIEVEHGSQRGRVVEMPPTNVRLGSSVQRIDAPATHRG